MMKSARTFLILAALLACVESSQACEPILPFIKVVGGPAIILGSWFALLAVIIIKSAIFSILQRKLRPARAFLFMIGGNILTTVVGVFVAALIGSGPMMFLAIVIVWPLFLLPAQRVIFTTDISWLKKLSPALLACALTLALVASCILFGISYFREDTTHLTAHWIWKLSAVYAALIPSIILTAFWEEWVVWKLSRCPVGYTGYVKPVVRANLSVLLCVMLYGAAIMIPQRLKSPHFLVKLGWLQHYTMK